MGGRVMQYSPVEEMIIKAVDKAKAEKDAEYNAIHETDKAEIERLLAEVARLKAAQVEKNA